MSRRSSETWWHEHWGRPCALHDPAVVTIGRAKLRVDGRAAEAFESWERVRARHGYDVHPAYPEGDTGSYNCRHIGNDEDRPWSVHAWGCAIDVNWNSNPDGSRLRTDIPQAMRDDLHALRTRSGAPVFRWGGDWDRDPRTGHSYYDAMHWEIVATPAELASGVIETNHAPDSTSEEDDLATDTIIIKGTTDDTTKADGRWWATDGVNKSHLPNRDVVNHLVITGALTGKGGQPEPHLMPMSVVNAIPTVTAEADLARMEQRITKALAGSGTGLSEAQATEVAAGAIRAVLTGLAD